jgi:hypothetical protein
MPFKHYMIDHRARILKKLYFMLSYEDLLRISRQTILLTLTAVMELFNLGFITYYAPNMKNVFTEQ